MMSKGWLCLVVCPCDFSWLIGDHYTFWRLSASMFDFLNSKNPCVTVNDYPCFSLIDNLWVEGLVSAFLLYWMCFSTGYFLCVFIFWMHFLFLTYGSTISLLFGCDSLHIDYIGDCDLHFYFIPVRFYKWVIINEWSI